MTATAGDRRELTTRWVSAGAPHTSSTASASGPGRSAGSTVAIDRPNRMACPAQGTCSEAASQPASPSVIASGVSDSDTRVATRCPARSPSGEAGPASSTTPMSIPPDPVTGFCILPRSATMPSTADRTAPGSPPCASRSWRNEAASRFSRSSRTRTSSGQIAGRGSSRQAACGSTPAGSATRCRPSGDPGPGRPAACGAPPPPAGPAVLSTDAAVTLLILSRHSPVVRRAEISKISRSNVYAP
jgi:hypothetical protein